MKLLKYMQSLLPRFEKRDLQSNVNDVRKELSEATLPLYDQTQTLMSGWSFKDEFTKDLDKSFSKMDTRFRGNFIDITHAILGRMSGTLDVIERLVDREFSRDIVKTAMSYSQAQILQTVEAMDFVTRYSRKLLIYTLSVETSLYRGNKWVGKQMTPAEVNWLKENRATFIRLLGVFDNTAKDLEKTIKAIPDVTVDAENIESVVATVGVKKLDPMGFSGYGFVMNPIYHIRIRYTEMQVARYESQKEEKKLLEYEILDLQNAMDGKEDPKIQKAIEYTQDRIAKLNRKIAKMEEKVDG